MKILIQNGLEFEAKKNETLLSAMVRAGVLISAPCGGRQHCGKCRVKILEGRVRDIYPENPAGENLPQNTVLACRTVCESDLLMALIPDEYYEDAACQKVSAKSPGQRIISRAATALDIGTTTISAQLLDLDSPNAGPDKIVDIYSALNNQRVFGADVISRINAAREGKTSELFKIVNKQINKMLLGFIEKFKLEKIETLTVAANTTMLHLFVNEDPSSMGEIPFKPVFLEEREFGGADLSLPVDRVFLLPSISAFIGADIVSGLAAINILKAGETVLFIDMGTNGEIALFHKGKLFCASAAAGPALEGAEISCGTGSVRGAISKAGWDNGKLNWLTIGSAEPLGICGSGLIDIMALMLEQGIIDETGAFTDNERREFIIAPGISIINRDVRQFQLSKSAILSAIKILCKNTGIELEEIKKVFVAGGLGFYLDQNSAVKSGLLPAEFLDRIEVCGNTSLKGTVMASAVQGGEEFKKYCRTIVKASESVDLASDPAFMDAFAENMLFPS